MFPTNMGGDLGGKTFDEIFDNDCKTIEFVRSCWIEDQCTGIFLEFYKYVMHRLNCGVQTSKHEARCREYVKTHTKLPNYLTKYN